MNLSIAECRKALGEAAKNMTDEEILELKNSFVALSDLAIDSYLAKKRNNTYEKNK